MKYHLCIVLLVGYVSEVFGQKPSEYYYGLQGLFGKVQSITEKRFAANELNGEIVKGPLRG